MDEKLSPVDRLLNEFMENVRPASDRAAIPYTSFSIEKSALRQHVAQLLTKHQEHLEEEVLLSPLRARIKELEAELEAVRKAAEPTVTASGAEPTVTASGAEPPAPPPVDEPPADEPTTRSTRRPR